MCLSYHLHITCGRGLCRHLHVGRRARSAGGTSARWAVNTAPRRPPFFSWMAVIILGQRGISVASHRLEECGVVGGVEGWSSSGRQDLADLTGAAGRGQARLIVVGAHTCRSHTSGRAAPHRANYVQCKHWSCCGRWGKMHCRIGGELWEMMAETSSAG